jgi:prevent-host-death family protein
MQTWQMQEAKARMSELVKQAQSQGPQEITMHGRPVAVVVSRETYDRLSQTGDSLAAFMRRSPLYGSDDIEFERDKSATREVAF